MTKKIGRIIAVYLIITGIGFLVSSEYYSKMITRTDSNPVLINLSGMVHFFIGMTILVHHFLWKSTLQIIVTLLGFIFLAKSFFLIVFPELTLQSGNNAAQVPWAMSIGFIAVGVIVGYMSFFKRKKGNELKPHQTNNSI
ncbi:hypothetical protein U6A24_04750 [Aquimarina gracilis]|uniref:Uncharacterized protein n=1 Tax=Aquimarina gracilis TaxID=874422 RepID=A0ABU5ZRU5_9FLAO|nr:hypothetical protein [Aquimarina gracilis]MEB3344754.1 hypothetical protein [Aquimarina gracilis]